MTRMPVSRLVAGFVRGKEVCGEECTGEHASNIISKFKLQRLDLKEGKKWNKKGNGFEVI